MTKLSKVFEITVSFSYVFTAKINELYTIVRIRGDRMLEGVTVLDLSQRFPGGYASLWLADLGAEVIRIEPVDASNDYRYRNEKVNDLGFTFAATGRNKKSIALNLKSKKGLEIFMDLAAKSNVIIEGFRPGVVSRLGIDYESIKSVNKSIVYSSLSGYGQSGDMSTVPGFDLNYQAISGILSLGKSDKEKPNLSGILLADIGAGLTGALSIISALFQQMNQKKGTYIDLAIADVPFHLMNLNLMHYFADGSTSFFANGEYCGYNVYQCKCGKWVALSGISSKFWENFCLAVERPDWYGRQFEPAQEGNKMFEELKELFKNKTQSEWVEFLKSKSTCVSPVISASKVMETKWAKDRSLTFSIPDQEKDDLPQIRLPFTLGDLKKESGPVPGGEWKEANNPNLPPGHGEHTEEILKEMGFSKKSIYSLSLKQVIKTN